jgi:hypothetical protein
VLINTYWFSVLKPNGVRLYRLSSRLLQLLVYSVLSLLHYSRFNEVMVEQGFENIQVPFCFSRFYVKYLTRILVFSGVRCEVADFPNSVELHFNVGC